MEHYYM